VDRPGGRKRHARPVPVVGGIAITVGIVAGLAAVWLGAASSDGPARSFPLLPLLAALAVQAVGVLDDARGLSPPVKLGCELAAATAAVGFSGISLLSELVGVGAGAVLAVLWLATITNAVNFLDGSDGLAGSVALAASSLLLLSAAASGQHAAMPLLAALCGALAGFLVFNLPPASAFLGDGGSLPLGFLLGYAAVSLTWFDFGWTLDTPMHALLAPLLVLAVPLYDFVGVIVLRLRARVAPWRSDERHLPHRLAQRGFGPGKIVLVLTACTLATGLGGVALPRVSPRTAILVAAQSGLVLLVLALLEHGLVPRKDSAR
jgi:UDP-GlcNAc:undecaprenyl-phosphate GlcNAc-1-phosphate transferase